jgi:3-dehydroquinate dehydratase/shikimate dehydrogenase
MGAKLCVTVTGQTMAELRKRRDEVTDADLVELRLDTAADPSAAAALADRRLPVVVTCRPKWEGGHFQGSEDERRRLLLDAQRLGAEYVDVEWKAGFADVIQARSGQGVVLSMHDFDGVPIDLADRAAAMRSTGAEVIKLAVMARRLRDNLSLSPIACNASNSTVVVAMGDAGLPSRVLAARFHSLWTYAGHAVAPGQLPASRLRDEYSFPRLHERTSVYGVVGRPVMHSLSPHMHNAAFRAAQIDAVYLPLAASDYDDFLAFAEAMSLGGASVTAPFKVDAFERADACDAMSRSIHSVNTLRRTAHGWEACNTDVAGFLAPLESRMGVRATRATVLGAGGAARGVAAALRAAGAQVTIAARNPQQAAAVAALTGGIVGEWPPRRRSWDLLVNATPVGTVPAVEDSPLPDGPFDGRVVYDLVYNPADTRLLRDARSAGCQTISGLEMLVAQAVRQFEWWTGITPSAHIMRDAATMALGASGRSGSSETL